MTKEYIVCVNPGLTFYPTFLPIAGFGTAYSTDIEARNGQAPYKFTLVSGALPDGVTFTDNGDGTATFAGTPTEAGSFDVVIRLRDVFRRPRERTYTLQVIALPLELSGSLANMTVGTPYSDTLTISGGVAPYSLPASTRPAGISASVLGSTITVSGTPTGAGLGPGSPKSFDVSITVEDANGAQITYTQTISITVPAVTWAPTYPDGEVGEAYDYTPSAATGGTGGYTYAVTSGSVPPGLTFVGSSGRLHGTPTDDSGSPYVFTVAAADSEGNSSSGASQSIDIIDNPDPYWANVVSLSYGDSVTGDETGKVWTKTGAGTIVVNSTDTQFGMPVLEWPGAASPATLILSSGAEDDFDFGGGDWTIQCRLKPAGLGGQTIFSKRPNTATTAGLVFYVSGLKPALVATLNGSSWGVNIMSAAPLTAGVTVALAARRIGNSWEIYVNETLVASTTASGSIPANSHAPRWSESGFVLSSAHLSQRRITKGIARDLTIAQTDAWPNS